jgi:hypothetical protein
MRGQPLVGRVATRLALAAQSLGTRDPTPPIKDLLTRTFALPDGDPRYADNALTPMAAPIEPSFSELQPDKLRFTIEPLGPGASGLDRRDEATREMRRLVQQWIGREALRWFDQRSEAWRGFGVGSKLNYGAFFGTATDKDGLYSSKVYYESGPKDLVALSPELFSIVTTALTCLPALRPMFTTIAAQRDTGGQRLTFSHPPALKLADLETVLAEMGLRSRLPGIMQLLGLTLGGRFELPPNATLLSFGQSPDGPEFEIYVLLGMIPDLPIDFLQLLSLGLSERPRGLLALERWMSAFTPEDEVWPGRFSILSLRTSARLAPRVSLYLRPVEFELPPQSTAARLAA